jgi:hypothetical protein
MQCETNCTKQNRSDDALPYSIGLRNYLKLLDCLAGATGERKACCLTLLLLALLLQGLSARLQLKLRMLKACTIQLFRLRMDVCAALSPKAMNEYRPVQDCECDLAGLQ